MKPYYFSLLSDDEKSNYVQIYSGIEKFQTRIEIENHIEWDNLWEIVKYIYWDYPDFAYFDRYGENHMKFCGNKAIFEPAYFVKKDDFFRIQKAFYEQCKLIVSKVTTPGMSDFDKEVALHDFILKNIEYGYVENKEVGRTLSQSAFCTLQHRKGVCGGITGLYKCLMNMAGIDCIYVYGYNGPAPDGPNGVNHRHAWNMVKLGDKWAHVDVTHDLNESCGHLDHTMINFTDAEAEKKDRHWDRNITPKCDSPELSYYVQRNLYITNEQELEKMIKERVNKKIYIFSFKVMGELECLSYDKIRVLVRKYFRKYGFDGRYSTTWDKEIHIFDVGPY